ncbi:MAG TPA: aa3-type cytochrome c oxidase subunit IV [Caulobacteraceae bacterium]
MAEAHSDDYVHGQMNAAAQAANYRSFLSLTKWFALHAAALILFLTLWFCTGAGFWAALFAAIIVLALGITFLRRKPQPVH